MDQIADVNLEGRIEDGVTADFFKQLFHYANYNPLYRSGKVPN